MLRDAQQLDTAAGVALTGGPEPLRVWQYGDGRLCIEAGEDHIVIIGAGDRPRLAALAAASSPEEYRVYPVMFTPPGVNDQGAPTGADLLRGLVSLEVQEDGYTYAAFGPKTREQLERLAMTAPAAYEVSRQLVWKLGHNGPDGPVKIDRRDVVARMAEAVVAAAAGGEARCEAGHPLALNGICYTCYPVRVVCEKCGEGTPGHRPVCVRCDPSPTLPEPLAVLGEIRDRLNAAHAHDCVGWDCAECGAMAASQLQGLISEALDSSLGAGEEEWEARARRVFGPFNAVRGDTLRDAAEIVGAMGQQGLPAEEIAAELDRLASGADEAAAFEEIEAAALEEIEKEIAAELDERGAAPPALPACAPCPSCRSVNACLQTPAPGTCKIVCQECGAEGPACDPPADAAGAAVRAWNRAALAARRAAERAADPLAGPIPEEPAAEFWRAPTQGGAP
jgi:hypothetical protein